ncbi:MAG: hypothetical protein ACTSPB_16265 [Candidatus Thorarchaeota archaeon]
MIRKLQAIIRGWYYYLFTDSKALIEERVDMCKQCPISKRSNGSYSGWCRTANGGCGCHLKAKSAHEDSSCEFGVWGKGFTSIENLNELIANGHG